VRRQQAGGGHQRDRQHRTEACSCQQVTDQLPGRPLVLRGGNFMQKLTTSSVTPNSASDLRRSDRSRLARHRTSSASSWPPTNGGLVSSSARPTSKPLRNVCRRSGAPPQRRPFTEYEHIVGASRVASGRQCGQWGGGPTAGHQSSRPAQTSLPTHSFPSERYCGHE
jgi:hypothetical protein